MNPKIAVISGDFAFVDIGGQIFSEANRQGHLGYASTIVRRPDSLRFFACQHFPSPYFPLLVGQTGAGLSLERLRLASHQAFAVLLAEQPDPVGYLGSFGRPAALAGSVAVDLL